MLCWNAWSDWRVHKQFNPVLWINLVNCDYSNFRISYNAGFEFLQVILALGDYMSIQCHACIGGTNVGEDIRKLDYGQHVVSGTPGRVFGKFFIFKQLSPSSKNMLPCWNSIVYQGPKIWNSLLAFHWLIHLHFCCFFFVFFFKERFKQHLIESWFVICYTPCMTLGLMMMTVQFADMIRRRSLRTRSIKLLVLDEADEMLNKGNN